MLRIVPFPHPALRYPARPVRHFNDELRELARGMFELMYEAKGVGLAAPQVARPYQMFVLNVSGEKEKPELEQVFINPEIVKRTSTAQFEEGCLSFPELFGKVFRGKRVKVKALDLEGKPFEVDADDIQGRAIQHEADHLKGKLFIDLFSTLGKIGAGKKIKEIERAFRAAQASGEYPDDDEITRQLDELASRPPA